MEKDKKNFNALTEEETYVIIHKGTERPFTGSLLNNKLAGTYICKQCDAPLYHLNPIAVGLVLTTKLKAQ
jgi:peptide-methionine (R)-S-oxide reductase